MHDRAEKLGAIAMAKRIELVPKLNRALIASAYWTASRIATFAPLPAMTIAHVQNVLLTIAAEL
jgi:hypothetical protein